MKKIDELYAFVAQDQEGDGIISMQQAGSNVHMPLVGADMERVESIMPIAKMIAKRAGKRLRLLRFKKIVDMEIEVDG